MTLVAYSKQRNAIFVDRRITDNSDRTECATKVHVLNHYTVAFCGSVFSAAIVAHAIQESGKSGPQRFHLPGLTGVVEGFGMSHNGVPYLICLERDWVDIVEWRDGNVRCVGSGSEYFQAFEAAGLGFNRSMILTVMLHPTCGDGVDMIGSDAKVSVLAVPKEHLSAVDVAMLTRSDDAGFRSMFPKLSF